MDYLQGEPGERAQKIALFRHSIISPVLNTMEESQRQYFLKVSEREHFVPGMGMKKFSISTLKTWLSKYRERGYEGLVPRVRRDKGSSRKVSPELKEFIEDILDKLPITTYTHLYNHLIEKGHIKSYDFSLQTFIKFIKDNNISLKKKEVVPRKKFEARHINQLWSCDFMHSIYIRDKKRKKQTFLCGIIDDHSRVIVGARWSFDSNLSTLERTFKDAILTYGLPNKLYCDNAKVFRSEAIHLPCAKLGIAMVHSRPADPCSRGKIERFFRTVQSAFVPFVDKDNIPLSKLNSSFQDWLKKKYNKKIHQGIGEPPIERYLKGLETISPKRISKENLDLIFYRILKRNVRKDCTVSVKGKLYEAPSKYIGTQVEIRYPTSSPDEFYIFENNKPADKLRPLDVHLNASQPYVSMSYSSLLNKKE